MGNWEKVGEAGVDSGLIWIGDPCYVVTPDANEHPAKTWPEFCDKIDHSKPAQQFNYKLGHPGLGVLIQQFGGDGTYDVFIKRDSHGMVTEAKIVLNRWSEEDEEVED